MEPKARSGGAEGRPRRAPSASAFGAANSHSWRLRRRGKQVMMSVWGQLPALGPALASAVAAHGVAAHLALELERGAALDDVVV